MTWRKKNLGFHEQQGHPKTIMLSVLRSLQCSSHKYVDAVGLSACSVRPILHEELKFHPYKLAVLQKLSQCDFVARENACEALLAMPHDALVFFSDKAIQPSRYINKQNMRYWSSDNVWLFGVQYIASWDNWFMFFLKKINCQFQWILTCMIHLLEEWSAMATTVAWFSHLRLFLWGYLKSHRYMLGKELNEFDYRRIDAICLISFLKLYKHKL